MALPVTEQAVRDILDVVAISDYGPFIAGADALVQTYLVGHGLSDAQLFETERWLSAHFVAMSPLADEARLTAERTGESTANYGGDLGKWLDFTRFGQQAKLLAGGLFPDDPGKLKARIRVIPFSLPSDPRA